MRHGSVAIRFRRLAWIIGILTMAGIDTAEGGIVSHRAMYTLSLESARPFSGIAHEGTTITAAEGFMAVEWRRACGGISSYQRFSLNIDENNGYRTLIETRFSSWEDRDGSSYEFDSAQWRNKQLVSQQKGEVVRRSDKSLILYEQSPNRQATLPAPTMFPAAHMRAILNAAIEGESILQRTVFDGADREGLNDISAFIGSRRPVKTAIADGEWKPKNYWPVQMAFYKHDSKESLPFFEATIDLTERGIPVGFVMDYEDFSLRGIPESIGILADIDCPDASP